MRRRLRRFKHARLLAVLVGILVVLVGTEVLFRIFDPTGAGRYGTDQFYAQQRYAPDPRGYSLPPGDYHFSNWSATINPDRTRAVPDTPAAAPLTLAFIGDSVTFAWGVSDADTWINLLAGDFPQVQFINTGVGGYTSTHVLASLEVYPADVYLWLTIPNDLEKAEPFSRPGYPFMSYAAAYLRIAQQRSNVDRLPGENDARYHLRTSGTERFTQEFEQAMNTYGDTLKVVSFDDEYGQWLAETYGVRLIPWYTSAISAADGHANVAGNAEIAAAMKPIVQGIVDELQ